MSTTTLALLSVAAVSTLFIALAAFLSLILGALEPTGGSPTSFLAKIRLGLRAIEVETGHIPGEVPALNAGLGLVAEGLGIVDQNLAQLASALQRQESR